MNIVQFLFIVFVILAGCAGLFTIAAAMLAHIDANRRLKIETHVQERGLFRTGTSGPNRFEENKFEGISRSRMRQVMTDAPKNPDGTLKEFSR